MPLNKLDNFIKNTEGRILYVSPSDIDSTDSVSNQGNSLAQPFKTVQRALIEAARFSYLKGDSNDEVEKTTILLMPGEHEIDNRPGYVLTKTGSTAQVISPGGGTPETASDVLSLSLSSNFNINDEDNVLYKFNSIYGGVIVPRGTSIVGLDLRKTKIRPKYVPNPTDSSVNPTAIFKITGACYFWQFSFFDGNENGLVYTDDSDFSVNNQSKPIFSHHKLTCFEYADGVNEYQDSQLTDLDMYYGKLSNAFNVASGRDIDDKYPADINGFAKQRPEWEIVGAFAADPIDIQSIISGDGVTASNLITVTTAVDHELTTGTPVKISGVSPVDYNISTKIIADSTDPKKFTYLLPDFRATLPATGDASSATVTVETDTVTGASPYIFNISLRSVYGMNGMHADGSKAAGFRSMVVAQFTGVSLQKDDRAFVKYNSTNRDYSDNIGISTVTGTTLSANSSSTGTVYHLDSDAIYRSGWETSHIKISNDAILQIVSVFAIGYNKHFDAQSGGDASITNSNSNFGQLALISTGFKKEAFAKDNQAYITNIITPRSVTSADEDIDWLTIDVGVTTSVADNSRLYLFGFNSEDNAPAVLTQGYRVGAKVNDKLYVSIGATNYSADILMSDGSSSSLKEYSADAPLAGAGNTFGLGTHTIETGEKVIIISDDGDLPENIEEHQTYYAIKVDNKAIKLATSESDANNNSEVAVNGGSSLKILSRVSEKSSGDLGHPVQWDGTNNQWYINVSSGNDIYTQLNTLGVSGIGAKTNASFIKRKTDSRSLDEKIYKVRVIIPKESTNAKNPENGFIIQESSTTGVRTDSDFDPVSNLTRSDFNFEKNPRFISTCSRSGTTVTVISELPHNLDIGDSINIRNVTDDTVTGVGTFNRGYNGTFTVSDVTDDLTFEYTTTATPGTFTNDTSTRTADLPRFERNNLQSNLYVYRNEIIKEYIEGQQDGIYHLYVTNSNNAIPTEFTDLKYSQNIVNLYPQLDRDNIDDNPLPTRSFAVRSPLGKVVTSDLKKSITKESLDLLATKLGIGLTISSVSNSATSATITFAREHGLSGIVTYSSITGGSGHTNGDYHNVKLYDNVSKSSWQGATARIGVTGGAVTSVDIISSGSGYVDGDTLYVDNAQMGGSVNSSISVSTSGISSAINTVVQFTGSTTTEDTLHRITSVGADNQISIAKTSGDTVITNDQYAVVVGPAVSIDSTIFDSTAGITTFICTSAHGLVAGNKFRLLDTSNNNLGDFHVKTRSGVTSFTSVTTNSVGVATYVLKSAFTSNDSISNSSNENLGVRGFSIYDNELLTLSAGITTTATEIEISSPVSGIATTKRFPIGSYIQVDEEIMRVASKSLTGASNNKLTVIRGVLATNQKSHSSGSLVKKIKPLAVEFRRPSIIRASGHTFEYLGYGPGNYSTGLPQVQNKTLNEREEFLVQSQERSSGIVVYTGMNNKGDFFIGNQKKSSATGEESTFDTPIPTVTGADPSRLSSVFDEVTIKERLVVEGGDSNQILSQFDGPVTFTNNVTTKNQVTSSGKVQITNTEADAFTVTGGSVFDSEVVLNTGIVPDSDEGAYVGTAALPFSEGHFGEIRIAVTNNNTIDTASGNLILDAATNIVDINAATNITGNTIITGILSVTDDITAFWSSDERLKDNITPIDDPLTKVVSISGNTFDWNEKSNKSGHDVGLIAQEIEKVLPEAVVTRDNGYLAVDYHKVVPLLVEAIKELSDKVETLEQKLSDK